MKRRRLSTAEIIKQLQPSDEEKQLFTALTSTLRSIAAPAVPRSGVDTPQEDVQVLRIRVESMEKSVNEMKTLLREVLNVVGGTAQVTASSPQPR